MAAQSWQQVLLADPKNTEALGGLARSAKAAGNTALANTFLDRLRAINPNDPGITRAAAVTAKQNQDAALAEASKYAQAGQYAQAMTIYRKVFGGSPPAGDWSLAYYETEAATEEGRPHAIAGLRAMSEKYPTEARYQVALGRILTYNPKTRVEGRRILGRHPSDAHASEAIRQSLVWDAPNPASGPEIRAYLAQHADPQLEQLLRDQPKAPVHAAAVRQGKPSAAEPVAGPSKQAAFPPQTYSAGAGGGKAMEEAYRALNAKHIEDAEARFRDLLATDPENARALAGMGYIRMGQSNFGGALSFLEQAKQNGARDPGLDPALATARFWFTMGEGAAALNENDLPTAEQRYQAALTVRPTSPEALEGLGGTLLKAQQPQAAIDVYEHYVRVKPGSPTPWRGLVLSEFGAGSAPQALLTERRIPPAVLAQLMRDPDFLRTLASAYSAVGRDVDAQRVLQAALELPFPADAGNLKIGTQLQYASLLQAANHLDQADGLYRQILAADPANSSAWQGMVRVQHGMKQDAQAVQTLQSMPQPVYEAAMRDIGFQTTVAAIYQEGNKPEVAQQILEHAVAQQTSTNQKPSVALEIQLAGIYLSRNLPQRAYPIYRQVLTDDPNRTDAWKGMLSVLHSSGRDQEALAQAQQISQPVRSQLEADAEYLQTMGAVYNSLGQPREAMVFINRVQQHYAARHAAAPSDVDIQDAWLLFNGANDAGLYRQLMLLGGRQDLTDEQRRTVQTIWTNWAVRRSNQDAAAGDSKRSLAILNAAAKAFPENPGVLRALASGYARGGLPKQAVAIFKAQDMSAATAIDYKAAVGAALAANDPKSAETWLRFGLEAYPRDAQMLLLGAKFEQARGNTARATDYFHASLAALPPSDPGAELAGELSQPGLTARLPSSTQPQDLASLLGAPATNDLDPNANVPPPRPYLPSYSNASGEAPVQLPGSSAVVPSYMTNPTRSRRPSNPVGQETLRNYVPQASVAPSNILPEQPDSETRTAASVLPSLPDTSAYVPQTATYTLPPLRNPSQSMPSPATSSRPPLADTAQSSISALPPPGDTDGITRLPAVSAVSRIQFGDALPPQSTASALPPLAATAESSIPALPLPGDTDQVAPRTAATTLTPRAAKNAPAPTTRNVQTSAARPPPPQMYRRNSPHESCRRRRSTVPTRRHPAQMGAAYTPAAVPSATWRRLSPERSGAARDHRRPAHGALRPQCPFSSGPTELARSPAHRTTTPGFPPTTPSTPPQSGSASQSGSEYQQGSRTQTGEYGQQYPRARRRPAVLSRPVRRRSRPIPLPSARPTTQYEQPQTPALRYPRRRPAAQRAALPDHRPPPSRNLRHPRMRTSSPGTSPRSAAPTIRTPPRPSYPHRCRCGSRPSLSWRPSKPATAPGSAALAAVATAAAPPALIA